MGSSHFSFVFFYKVQSAFRKYMLSVQDQPNEQIKNGVRTNISAWLFENMRMHPFNVFCHIRFSISYSLIESRNHKCQLLMRIYTDMCIITITMNIVFVSLL